MTKIRANQTEVEEILNDPNAGANTTKKGTVEIATQVEVDAGVDTERVITPATLKNFTGTFEPADSTILKDADIGVTVQAFDATILVDADIGITIEQFITKNTGFNLNLGTIAGTVSEGDHTHTTFDTHIADSTIHFTSLDGLSDVVIGGSPLLTGQTLMYDGVSWINQTPASGITDHTLLSNIGTNTHAQIDTHISDTTIHFTEGSIDHTAITNIGTNTHAQIDAHIAGSPIHFTQAEISITESQISDLQSYLLNITNESIGDLSDVVIGGSPLLTGQTLTYDGVSWINQTPPSGITDHTLLSNIGTNTHAQIDTHISAESPHNNWIYANSGNNFSTAPTATGTNSIAIGKSAQALGSRAVAIGDTANILTSSDGIAIGRSAAISGNNSTASIAIGYGAFVNTNSSRGISIGFSTSSAYDAVAIGPNADAAATTSIAIGRNTISSALSIAMGNNTSTTQTGQVVIGASFSGAETDVDVADSVKLGQGGATLNVLHLFSKGKLELYGDDAQFIIPSYITGSIPSTTNLGGLIYDTTTNELKVYDAGWNAVGGAASVALNDLTDVVIGGSPLLTGHTLTYDGVNWINQTPDTGVTDHTLLSNIGTNTHAQIDTHISAISPHNNWIEGDNGSDFAFPPSAGGTDSLALGRSASSSASRSIAVGYGAISSGADSLAVGLTAISGTSGTAIGKSTNAYGENSVAIGNASRTTSADTDAVAVGIVAHAYAIRAIAIGRSATVSATDGIAIGNSTNTTLLNQVAIGKTLTSGSVTSDVAYSIKLGHGLTDVNKNVLHLFSKGKLELYGAEAQFVMPNYAAGSPATYPANSVTGGTIYDSISKTLQVYDGTVWGDVAPTPAAELNDLTDVVIGGSPLLTGHTLTYDGVNWINQTPASRITDHTLLINIGTNTHAQIDTHISDATIHFTTLDGLSDVVISGSPLTDQVLRHNGTNWVNSSGGDINNNWLIANNGTDFGTAPTAAAANGIALGFDANAVSTNGIAIGHTAYCASGESVAIGSSTDARQDSVAIGNNAAATDSDAVAIGGNTIANTTRAVAVGFGALARGIDSVAIGGASTASAKSDCLAIGSGCDVLETAGAAVGYNSTTSLLFQNTFGGFLTSTSVTSDVTYSIKLGYGASNTNKNMIHLYSKGKLELYGDEAQFVIPTYAVGGSPNNYPANSVEGGLVFDSVNNILRVYDGTVWGDVAPAGASELNDLTDVVIGGSPLLTGHTLTYDGANWINQTPDSGVTDHTLLSNIGTNTHAQIDTHISDTTVHFSTLDGLSDVVFGSPATSEVLTFNGTNWVNAPLTGEANNNWLTANNSTNFSPAPIATGAESIALGEGATTAANTYSIAVGTNATVSGGNGVSIGKNSEANTSSVGLGNLAEAKGSYSIAIGRSANTSATSTTNAIAIGNNVSARANTQDSIVIGSTVQSYQATQLNVGWGLRHGSTPVVDTDVPYSVKLGYGTAANRNMLHLFSKGKLELYGDEAQFVFPNYAASGSPTAYPANSVAGGTIYDSITKTLQVYDGAAWGDVAPAGGTSDHTLLTNIGTNTHAQIDAHIAQGSPPIHNTFTDVVQDTTPQLGGNLDINGFEIVGGGTGGGYITIRGNNSVDAAGTHIAMRGGDSSYAGSYAGYASLYGGDGTSSTTGGGSCYIFAGAGDNGGQVFIDAGDSNDGLGGGGVKIWSGDSLVAGGEGGDIEILSGGGHAASGIVQLASGDSTTAAAGPISVIVGDSGGATAGSAISLFAGVSGSTGTVGGDILLRAGGVYAAGTVGSVIIQSDNSGIGTAATTLKFNEGAGGINFIGLKAPDTLSADVTFVLPELDGANGEVLSTDGSGNLSFAAAASALNDLTDVVIGGSPLVTDQVLTYDGANWVNATSSGGEDYVEIEPTGALPSALGTGAIAIGGGATTSFIAETYGIAIGKNATANRANNVAIGSDTGPSSGTSNSNSIAIGNGAKVFGSGDVSIGLSAISSIGSANITIGQNSLSKGTSTSGIAIGNAAASEKIQQICIGKNVDRFASSTNVDYSVKIGYGLSSNADFNMLHLHSKGKLQVEGDEAQFVLPNYITASIPSTTVTGGLIYDTDTNELKVYDAGWNAVGGGSVALNDLTDVVIGGSPLLTDDVLAYDGSNWINKPVDNRPTYEIIDITGSPVSDVVTTTVSTVAAAGNPFLAGLMVFRNGAQQTEGVMEGSPLEPSRDFAVTGANEITFTTGTLEVGNVINIYVFE